MQRFLGLSGLGALSGFVAAFMGLGGGILLFPLLLYLPPYLDWLPRCENRRGPGEVRNFFAGVVGGFAHWRKGRIHTRLNLLGGFPRRWDNIDRHRLVNHYLLLTTRPRTPSIRLK